MPATNKDSVFDLYQVMSEIAQHTAYTRRWGVWRPHRAGIFLRLFIFLLGRLLSTILKQKSELLSSIRLRLNHDPYSTPA